MKNVILIVEIEYLRLVEKCLVELGFLEIKDIKIKVKVELVWFWLLKNYFLFGGEDRKRIKNNMI